MTNREEGSYNTDCRFTGKLFDTSTNLYYYGARYYDPELGRFIQPDTIVPYPSDPQSFNRYSYCRNNPINYIDPTGHSWLSKILGAIAGIAVGIATQNFALGMAVFSAVDAGISAAQAGANVFQAVGVSLAAATAAYVGAQIGAGFGEWVGGGSFGASVFGGMFGGAAGGATRAALTGGDVVGGMLIGGGVGTGMGIMVGGFTYTRPTSADTQSTSASRDNPATNTAIKNGNTQGASDAEVNTSNQAPVVSRKIAGDKIAIAAEKGAVGTGSNPVSTTVNSNGPKPSRIGRFFALNIARAEVIMQKIAHAPIHLLATISEAYGPRDTPLGVYLDQKFPAQPLVNACYEELLSPLDELLENSIERWQYWVDYYQSLEGY